MILLAVSVQGLPQNSTKRKIVCKTPQNAASCYWTHGRLSFYNGTPSYRLWKIGTKRLLGIYSGPSSERIDPLDNEHPELPANLAARYDMATNSWVYADFEVCPLAPERRGFMQPACIESAKNIYAEKAR